MYIWAMLYAYAILWPNFTQTVNINKFPLDAYSRFNVWKRTCGTQFT